MTPAQRFHLDKRSLVPAFVGVWAAAFGIAPNPQYKLLVAAPPLLGMLAWWTIRAPERWLALFFFASLLLPPLPFPIGNSGIHVAPAIALLGLAAGGLRSTEWGGWRGSLPLLFVLFLAVLTGSLTFAALYSGWMVALGSLARVFLFAIGVYVFLYTLAGPRDASSDPLAFARFVFVIGLAGAVFACADFYFQWPAPAGYGAQFVSLVHSAMRRAQGVFYEASTLGNFCAFFLTMILVGCFPAIKSTHGRDRVFPRVVLAAGAPVFAAALICSYSRASVVTVAVAVCAFVYVRGLKIGRVLPVVCALLAVAAAVVRFALPDFWANYWLRLTSSIRFLLFMPDGVLSGRVTHWGTLTDFLGAHPWHLLFGIGYKTIPYTDYVGASVVADNTYLSLLVETGVVGLITFALLNWAILRTALRAARSGAIRASFFGTWIFCFWCGELVQMLTGDLITYWRVLPVYFWVLATAAREAGE